MTTIEQIILDAYRHTESIKDTAKALRISDQTIRRVLVQYGEYTSQRAHEVNALREAGKTVDEIAEELHIARNTVIAYLPYTRGPYISQKKTKNAMRIKAWRTKKRRTT